jgi:ribosomal protein S18 acetylase RimI-like enzyme
VRASNTAAVQFYRNLGFKIDEVVGMGKRLEADQP